MLKDLFKRQVNKFKKMMRRSELPEVSEEYKYLQGNTHARDPYEGFDPDSKRVQEPQEKVLRESGGQDISAI